MRKIGDKVILLKKCWPFKKGETVTIVNTHTTVDFCRNEEILYHIKNNNYRNEIAITEKFILKK